MRRRAPLALGRAVAGVALAAACSSGAARPAAQPASSPERARESVASTPPPTVPAEVAAEPQPPATDGSDEAPVMRAGCPAVDERTGDGGPGADGSVVLPLVDRTRPTVTSWGACVSSSRSLPTTVWLPSGAARAPLLVFAHGYRVGVEPYLRLLRTLVEHGYAVAAPSFPLTDEARAGNHLDEDDIDNEPADVSFVIDSLLADPTIAPRIDPTKIGLVGHSDGASVVVGLAYSPLHADPRVKAVVALTAGPLDQVRQGGPPALLEMSDTDEYDDLSDGYQLFDQVPGPKWFLVLHGATHLGPVEGGTPWTPVLDDTVVAFLDRWLLGTATDAAISAPADGSEGLASITEG